MRNLFVLSVLLFLFNSSFSQTVNEDYWDGRVYFKLKNSSNIVIPNFNTPDEYSERLFDNFPEFKEFVNNYDVYEFIRPFKTKTPAIERIYRVKFNNIFLVEDFIAQLERLDYVEYAEQCPIYKLFTVPSDTLQGLQYYLDIIQAYDAWEISTGSRDVKVAIVDDAVRTTHPDLEANIWINTLEIPDNGIDDDGNGFIDDVSGWDAADNNNNPNPPNNPPAIWGEFAFTHGTHCAGLAAAVTDNTTGIASVSHNVSIIPVKTVKNSSWVPLAIGFPAEGVDYAIVAGADIVSMSFGGAQASGFGTLEQLIDAGSDNGIIFVAAAGNNGNETINYPAAFDNVLAVGATDSTDSKASFSQFGDWIDIMAPGAAMYSTLAWSKPYDYQDGTSMACPLTAGVLALMKSYKPDASAQDLIYCLKAGCDNIDATNPDFVGLMGAGRVNALNSLLCLNTVGVEQVKNNASSVFPNPATNMLNIYLPDGGKYSYTVYNITGQIMMTGNLYNSASIAINSLPNGIYSLVLTSGNDVVKHRFSVSK